MNKKKTLCSGELKGCTGEYTTAQARCMLKEPQKKKKKGQTSQQMKLLIAPSIKCSDKTCIPPSMRLCGSCCRVACLRSTIGNWKQRGPTF